MKWKYLLFALFSAGIITQMTETCPFTSFYRYFEVLFLLSSRNKGICIFNLSWYNCKIEPSTRLRRYSPHITISVLMLGHTLAKLHVGLLLLSRFSRVRLCVTPIDSSPPGSLVPGILQARTLEWVATSFSNAGKWKVKVKLHRAEYNIQRGYQPNGRQATSLQGRGGGRGLIKVCYSAPKAS